MAENDYDEGRGFLYRVVDLKQYVYCPRVAYYQTVLPAVRPVTFKMEQGVVMQEVETGRERRRSLRAYGLSAGERSFNVPLASTTLGLSGELDMLIETKRELIAVDYKNSKRIGAHFKLQLMAYGRLLEEAHPQRMKAVRRGFLYLIPQCKAIEVVFGKRLQRQLAETIVHLGEITQESRFPAATNHRRKCADCEFRRFCNDVF